MSSVIRLAAGLALLTLPAPVLAGEEPVNLIAGSTIEGNRTLGDLSKLSLPDLLPEATPPRSPESVRASAAGPLVQFDLGRAQPVRAILLQADHNDSYTVHASPDGVNWEAIWTADPVYVGPGFPEMGLRTRTVVLQRPVQARFLQIHGAGTADGLFSIARFRVHAAVPANWPPPLDYSLPRSRPPLFPRIDIAKGGVLVTFLAALALVVSTWNVLAAGRDESNRSRRWRRRLIYAVIACSFFAWPNFLNFHFGRLFHNHEFLHYYLGSKYTRELGYTRLYACVALAEVENGNGREMDSRQARDLRDNSVVPAATLIADPSLCLSAFDEARWNEFREDVQRFRERTASEGRWRRNLLDHGFNATPAWMIAGTVLSNLGPPGDGYLSFLSFLDLGLLILTFVLIRRTFGLVEAFGAITFFCLNGIATYLYTGGCYLRYDWLACLVAGVCALRAGRDGTAGFLLATSTLLRVFPGVALLAIGAKATLECIRGRSPAPLWKYARVGAGALLAVAVLVPSSMVVTGRFGVWKEFASNSRKHLESEASNRIGLASFLDTIVPDRVIADDGRSGAAGSRSAARGLLRFGVLLAFCAVLGVAVSRRPPWVAVLLSVGLVPFVLDLSNYYFVVLVLFGLYWSVCRAAAYGLAVLTWLSWLPLALLQDVAKEFAALTWMVLALTLVVTILLARLPVEHSNGPPPVADAGPV